jgi:hypothetical protein
MEYDEITPLSVCGVTGFELSDFTDMQEEEVFANTNITAHY